jgi:hypothetical protein
MEFGLATNFVMPGLVPGIHVLTALRQKRREWLGQGERKRRRPSDGLPGHDEIERYGAPRPNTTTVIALLDRAIQYSRAGGES